jgi:ubiquinone/menaquinone biosynthesis C-methylase UbiE
MEATDRVFAGNIPDTDAGTGALTREIASLLPTQARIVATDLNQPMLDLGAAKEPHDNRIIWQRADALALPFGPQGFDVVAYQFGVMFFPDKVRGYREAYRVLKELPVRQHLGCWVRVGLPRRRHQQPNNHFV